MILGEQKYQNTSRTISGLLNVVFPNDVILLCDTSAGAVELELADIPYNNITGQGFWNNQYKLYIVDKSNNASVNNITIKAPAGYTVNNAATFVLSTNGATAIIRIANNTNYLVGLGFGAGTGSIIVQDEGVTIAPTATTLNFVGAGVTATAVGNVVTVNIAGTAPVTVTSAQLLALIASNSIVPNTWYIVSNAIFTSTVLETVPVLVQGVTSNAVSISGSGIFFNADYQQVGNYSGVTGFVANIGVWKVSLAPVNGDVVIWNNLHWRNLTGGNGVNPPNLDAVNWVLLTKSATNGYILEVDDIQYRADNNRILTRSDKRLNIIANNFDTILSGEAFLLFQWGNNEVQNNVVVQNSCFNCRNNEVITSPASFPAISLNRLSIGSFVELAMTGGVFYRNVAEQRTNIQVVNSNSFTGNGFTSTGGTLSNSGLGAFIDNTFSYNAIVIVNTGDFRTNSFKERNINIVNSGLFTLNESLKSTFIVTSNTGSIVNNNFEDGGLVVNVVNDGRIDNNKCLGGINVETNDGAINGNVLTKASISVTTINSALGSISANELSNSALNVGTNSLIIESNVFNDDVSANYLISVNSGEFRRNIFEKCDLNIVANQGIMQNNNCSQGSIFSITTINRGTISNNVISQTSNFTIGTNDTGTVITDNRLVDRSVFNIVLNTGSIVANNLSTNSEIRVLTENKGVISANNITQNSRFTININDVGANIQNNTLSDQSVIDFLVVHSGSTRENVFNKSNITFTVSNGSTVNLNSFDYVTSTIVTDEAIIANNNFESLNGNITTNPNSLIGANFFLRSNVNIVNDFRIQQNTFDLCPNIVIVNGASSSIVDNKAWNCPTMNLNNLNAIQGNIFENSFVNIQQGVTGGCVSNTVNDSNVTIVNNGDFALNTFLESTGISVTNVATGNEYKQNYVRKCTAFVVSTNNFFRENTFENTDVNVTANTGTIDNNDFISSFITVVDNTGTVTRNNFFESKLDVFIINSGGIGANNCFNSGIEVDTNSGGVGSNVLNNATLKIATNSGQIQRNDINGGFVVIGVNTDDIRRNIFANNLSVNILTNNGSIENNNFESGSVQIATNQATISSNTMKSSSFGVNLNEGLIERNNVTQESNLTITTNSALGVIENNSLSEDSTFTITTNALNITRNQLNTRAIIIIGTNNGEFNYNIVSQQSLTQVGSNTARGTVESNTVTEESQLILGTNDSSCNYNYLSGLSLLDVFENSGNIGLTIKSAGNKIINKSRFTVGGKLQGAFVNNCIDQETSITASNDCNGDFDNCRFQSVSISATDINGSFGNLNCTQGGIAVATINFSYTNGGILRGNYNTISVDLDLNDPAIYNAGTQTLTIPTEVKNFAGTYKLDNAAGQTIAFIANGGGLFLKEFFCESNTVIFSAVASAPHVNNYIVADTVGNTTIVGRIAPSIPDSIIVKTTLAGFSNAIVEKRVFA